MSNGVKGITAASRNGFSADDVSKINKSVYAIGNFVEVSNEVLFETTSALPHKMSLSSGEILFDGRHVVVSGAETEYGLIASDGFYRKVITGIRYKKDDDGYEDFEYVSYYSDEYQSSDEANDSTITLPPSTIDGRTEAFMPLFKTIVGKTSEVRKETLFSVIENYESSFEKINELRDGMSSANNNIASIFASMEGLKLKNLYKNGAYFIGNCKVVFLNLSFEFAYSNTGGGNVLYKTYDFDAVVVGYGQHVVQLPIAKDNGANLRFGLAFINVNYSDGKITVSNCDIFDNYFHGYIIKTNGTFDDYKPSITLNSAYGLEVNG